MTKKKILFIILGMIVISFFVIVFFFLLNTNKNVVAPNGEPPKNTINKMPQAATDNNKQLKANVNSIEVANSNVNPAPSLDPVIQAKYFNELRTNHPEFSATQIEFYNSTATNQDMSPCRGREDEANCVYAVALITRFYNFCGEIPNNKEKQIECADIILSERANAEIAKCQTQTNNDIKTQCLVSLFSVYEKPENCFNLKNEEAKKMCENITNFKVALDRQDSKLCENITDNSLKNTCLEDTTQTAPTISDIPTNPSAPVTPKDTDGDGLSDQDELNKYFTNPLLTDTDGDTFFDSAEISGGYNPCGDGKLPALELLPELCAKYKK